ncbi:hypothetical protein DD236_07145, partial [Ancrocorticia populi]
MNLPEIDLGIPWAPHQLSKPIRRGLVGLMSLFDVGTDSSVRALIIFLGDNTLEHPFGGMTLFTRTATIEFKDLINELLHRVRHHTPGPAGFHRDLWGKVVYRHIFSDRVTRNTEPASDLASTSSITV